VASEVLAMKVHMFKRFYTDPNDTISTEETREWERADALWWSIMTNLAEKDLSFKLLQHSLVSRCEGLGSQ
jgi:hypothetical protein